MGGDCCGVVPPPLPTPLPDPVAYHNVKALLVLSQVASLLSPAVIVEIHAGSERQGCLVRRKRDSEGERESEREREG